MLIRVLGRLWRGLKQLYLLLLPLRFNFIVLAILLFAFRYSDQGIDILRSLTDQSGGDWRFYAFSNLLAYELWYWSRHLLRYRPNAAPIVQLPAWSKWTPRVVGVLVFAIEIGGVLMADGQRKWIVAGLLAFWAIVYWLFVVYRRRRFGLEQDVYTKHVSDVSDFRSITQVMFGVAIVVEIILFAWAWFAPVSWNALGVAGTLLLTIAVWVPAGTALTILGERYRFPVFTALLLWAIVISPHADNHEIRRSGPLPQASRPSLEQAVNAWYARVEPLHRGKRIPMFIVATEGGGIRAAYWTATVLTAITDKQPAFADHCFAISGVSGGSLGAVVYDAVLANRQPGTSLQEQARSTLNFDALSGTLARLAQPDLAQRFVPIPHFRDREEALERGWEDGWSEAHNNDGAFGGAFVATMQAHPTLPNLFLNGTLVETGGRIVTSNVALHPSPYFRNAFDAFEELQYDIPMSTAAGMSARFTYVSPAGKIPFTRDCHDANCGRELLGHVVDGGYFENSGAVTASEIVEFVRDKHPDVDPYVILIDFWDNVSKQTTPFCPAPGDSGPMLPRRAETFMNEVMSPLRAVLSAREARGTEAVGDILTSRPAFMAEFRLEQSHEKNAARLPLGWVLSDAARDAIDAAIKTTPNQAAIANIADWLAGNQGVLPKCVTPGCADMKGSAYAGSDAD